MKTYSRYDAGKRNFWAMFIEGGFYFTGYTFFDVNVIIPVFVDAMTGDLRLAGLAATIRLLFAILPQLFMGHYTPKIKNVPLFLGITGFASRFSFFSVPVVLLLSENGYMKVLTLYIILAVGAFGDGLTHVPWLDILGRTIKENERGRLLGYQQFLGGIGGLIAGFIIKAILAGTTPVSTKYAMLFVLGAISLTTAGILLFVLRDTERSEVKTGTSMVNYLTGLHRYVAENSAYRKFLLTQCLAYFSSLASPLYILFAKNHLNLSNSMVTTLMYIQIIGGLAGGVIWGTLSHRKGSKFTIQVSVVLNIAIALSAAFLVFFNTPGIIPFIMVIIFGAGILQGAPLGYTNYLLDITSDEERPIYIAITSTIQFPFSLISFAGGIMAKLSGFLGVFITVAIFMGLTFMASTRLSGKREHYNI